jgi:mannose-1-phosphate guanylyltransferase
LPSPDPALRITILAGGIGSRFWPASRPDRPKQLLPLASERPLIVDTVERALRVVPGKQVRILAGSHLVEPFRRALGDVLDVEVLDDLFWIEPRPRGTAPVLVWAAHRMHRDDPASVMISLHSDHFIEPEPAFLELLPRAAALAREHDLLFTIAVPPDRPETGYGYLRPGAPLGDAAWRLGAFVEKPDHETAVRYLAEGYLWNSGIFVWSTARFLEEVRLHAPEVAEHLHLLDAGRDDEFFEVVSPISVDEAVLERSGRVGTLRATFRWDDVGNWDALARTRPADGGGNVCSGESHLLDARGNVVWAEDGPIVLFGVDDLVVARSGGVTLVAPRERASELKELVNRLPARVRDGMPAAPGEGDPPPPREGAARERPGSGPDPEPQPSDDGVL